MPSRRTRAVMEEAKPDKLRMSHNRISIWQACHLKYRYYYIDKLMPKEEKAYPLQVGDIVHKLKHLWYSGELTVKKIDNIQQFVQSLYPDNTEETTLNVAADAGTLMAGYLRQFGTEDPIEIISSEVQLQVEFPNYYLFAIVDALGRPKDKKLWRVETKTTARMDSYYLNGLKGGLQGAIYDFLTEEVMKEQVKGTIYDLIVKTKIPSYHRAYAGINRQAIKRALETVEGVYQEIQRAEYFPSSRCFSYNRECDYALLCNNDTLQTRKEFYKVREETPTEKEVKIGEDV